MVMTTGGIFFQYGALDARNLSIPVMNILANHLIFRGDELFEVITVPDALARAKSFAYDGLKSGQLKPVIDKVFPFEQIADAHRYMESNGQTGKIIVRV